MPQVFQRRRVILPMTNPLRLGAIFPDYKVKTTKGDFSMHQFFNGEVEGFPGEWTCFFCHPDDFTPVCTTECADLVNRYDEFVVKRGCKLIGLSCGSIESHHKWAEDIFKCANYYAAKMGIPAPEATSTPYPLIADDRFICSELGMLDGEINMANGLPYPDRTLLILHGAVIKFAVWYPVFTGRNFDEILRVLDSIQAAHAAKQAVNQVEKNWSKSIDEYLEAGAPLPDVRLKDLAERHEVKACIKNNRAVDCQNLERLVDALYPNCHSIQLRLKTITRIPDSVTRLTGLKTLDLSNSLNLIELPESIGDLQSLVVLNLYFCMSLLTLPESVTNLRRLATLRMTSCLCVKALPAALGNLSELKELDLSYCSKLPSLPSSIGGLKSVQELNLSYCWFLQELPESIGGMQALHTLQMVNCSGLQKLPESLCGLEALTVLGLNGCTGLLQIPAIKNLTALSGLDLSFCANLQRLPKGLLHTESLRTLNVYGCSIDVIEQVRAATDANPKLSILGVQSGLYQEHADQ